MSQPITWQNIGMPQNIGANQLLGMAQEQYANAFQGLGNIAQGFRKDNIAKDAANSEAQLNWFTEQARNLKPEQFTPETMNALLANVTDPAARQAAVDSFSKLGDEITGRAFQQEQRQAFTADEAQKALLRPLEVDKAKQNLRLGDAQIEAEKASTNASNAAAAANNLRTEALRFDLNNAKTVKQEDDLIEKTVTGYSAEMAGGVNPTTISNRIAADPRWTPKQRVKLLDSFDMAVNSFNRLDPVLRKEVEAETNKINSAYESTIAAIDAQHKTNLAKLPVDSRFTQVVGQGDVNKKVQSIAGSATGGIAGTIYNTSAAEIAPRLSKGLDKVSADFEKQLDIELKPYIPDSKERAAVIAEEQRSGGLQKVQSLALDTIIPTGEDKEVSISSDGKEVVDAANRMIKPYAVSIANLRTREEMEAKANVERLNAASERAKKLNDQVSIYQRTGVKQYPDLKKSIDSTLKKTPSK